MFSGSAIHTQRQTKACALRYAFECCFYSSVSYKILIVEFIIIMKKKTFFILFHQSISKYSIPCVPVPLKLLCVVGCNVEWFSCVCFVFGKFCLKKNFFLLFLWKDLNSIQKMESENFFEILKSRKKNSNENFIGMTEWLDGLDDAIIFSTK